MVYEYIYVRSEQKGLMKAHEASGARVHSMMQDEGDRAHGFGV